MLKVKMLPLERKRKKVFETWCLVWRVDVDPGELQIHLTSHSFHEIVGLMKRPWMVNLNPRVFAILHFFCCKYNSFNLFCSMLVHVTFWAWWSDREWSLSTCVSLPFYISCCCRYNSLNLFCSVLVHVIVFVFLFQTNSRKPGHTSSVDTSSVKVSVSFLARWRGFGVVSKPQKRPLR